MLRPRDPCVVPAHAGLLVKDVGYQMHKSFALCYHSNRGVTPAVGRDNARISCRSILKDIKLFVDRHLVNSALGNLLFQKDSFAPEVEVVANSRWVGLLISSGRLPRTDGSKDALP